MTWNRRIPFTRVELLGGFRVMPAATVSTSVELLDPACVRDVFVEGIGAVTRIGKDCIRFTLYATRDRGDGEVDRIVVAQIVWPASLIAAANLQVRMFLETGL